ncbi:MAG: asparagine synthase (glutamine-hydrolyzing) [Oscillospiraceae bacterium]|nr:asparagine synthase (glutamine-hydrolyzing) [Oscillospiraceae bacterium]
MCAIAGMIDLQADDRLMHSMLETMRRRGPDSTGWYQHKGCTLLHARLVVIDPAGGCQPMTLHWGEECYTIVYNGELYNTPELRLELLSLGHHFDGHSDTEVLLHGYAQWGQAVLERCNGIYAFAVWEEKASRLFLARDRMGVKPLFYTEHDGGLIFASEIKTILRYPTVRPQLDEQGAAEILLLGPGRTPGCGVFRGIKELKPGWCGYYEKGHLCLQEYWRLRDREHSETFAETAEHVRQLVLDAIHRQMVSDVPVGTFLSGGLDSSLITAVCANEMAGQGKPLSTFSVDYVDNDKYFVPNAFQPNSDGYYIRLMQDALQTEHHWCMLTSEDLAEALEESTYARDLPGMADVDFSLLVFCKRIREHVTVALSGECADEIFGGYPWYRDPKIRDTDGFPWAQNTAQRCAMLSPELSAKIDGADYVRQRYLDTCRKSDILPGTSPLERRMKEMVNLNQQWFMQTLLDRKDRMSMYSGLEVRVPFCDHRIAEYLYGVPWEFKDWQGREKGLLRCAMEGWLPEEVMWRKKSPYPKTFDPAYLAIMSKGLERLLSDANAPLFSLISRQAACDIMARESPWPWYGQLMRKPQTIAYLLQIDHWLRDYQIQICF